MKTKEIKGITLITLAITIVILLILAGISISIVIGNNSLIDRAKSTQKVQTIAGIKEALELEKVDIQVESKTVNLENYFDGEVSILIVDKDYRKRRIGKKLLLDVFKLAKNDNMVNLQIVTDESCNYKFYENLGCKKIYETVIKNKESNKLGNAYQEKAFIYEKKL